MADLYCVYEHVFPNGKKYIGISSDAVKRWRNGKGYKEQTKVSKAIKKYGWDNIKHNIILDGLTKKQAETIEKYLISELHTIDNGYNVAIGGENINSTYLNDHILYMIRESKVLDRIYQQEQKEYDIVSIFEKGKYNEQLAELLNEIDKIIEAEFCDYKKIRSNPFFDGRLERCEAYWYYASQILDMIIDGKRFEKEDIIDYITFRTRMYVKDGKI